MDDDFIDPLAPGDDRDDLPGTIERVRRRTNALGVSASSFSAVMTKAFSEATVGGKQFDDVLKSMALKLSGMAVQNAFKPVAKGITSELTKLVGSVLGIPVGGGGRGGGGDVEDGGGNCCCAPRGCFSQPTCFPGLPQFPMRFPLMPFASGGVIGTPSYFPLAGGLGLAGEAGPEAIMPLTRGADGRLGVAMSGAGAPANVTVQIATPDPASFRRSEAYITGQIARAVARGQRGF